MMTSFASSSMRKSSLMWVDSELIFRGRGHLISWSRSFVRMVSELGVHSFMFACSYSLPVWKMKEVSAGIEWAL